MSDLIGQIIRGYHIEQKIGAGGYGAVYKAHQPDMGRDVAIKMILPDLAGQPEFQQRFYAEARLVARLEHPNIIPLYEYWQDDTGAFLVMRYVEGGSLYELLYNGGAMSVAQTVWMMEQITSALAVAHEAGVVHCDLKPANILLDKRGNAYLTDFGIARTSDHTASPDNDEVAGTMAYLSPEQIQSREITPQSDICALGIVLYEMLTGRHPFSDSTLNMTLMNLLNDPLPDIRTKRPDLPGEMDVIIQRATAKNPAERYPSVRDLTTDLRKALSAFPDAEEITAKLPAPPAPLITQVLPTSRRTPRTTSERNRHAMLDNVYAFWIEGVLNNALRGAALIQPGLEALDEAVNKPPTVLRREGASDITLLPETPILDSYDRLNGNVLILGEPGCGKTMLLLELARDLIRRARVDKMHAIPVVLNLSSWAAEALPLADWLIAELRNKYQVPRRVAQHWVEDDDLLLLLDGLDEVAAEKREACVGVINTYRENHPFVDMVVCSRRTDYQLLSTRLTLNGAVLILPLEDRQIDTYLAQGGKSLRMLRSLVQEDETLREMIRSPLMLNIVVMAYEGAAQQTLPEAETPDTWRNHLFALYVRRMMERRADHKAYTDAEIQQYLTWLARQMQAKAQSVFLIENLQPDSLSSADYGLYRRLLTGVLVVSQALIWGIPRYVTTPFAPPGAPAAVKGLAWGTAGSVWGFIMGGGFFWKRYSALLAGAIFGIAVSIEAFSSTNVLSLVGRLIPALIIYTIVFSTAAYLLRRRGHHPDTIRSVELVQFNRAALKPSFLVSGMLVGIVTSVLNRIVYNRADVTQIDQLIGMIGGAIAAGLFALCLGAMTGGEVGRSTRPNEAMRRTLANSLKMGLLVTAGFAASLLTSTVPVSSLTYGLVQVAITAVPFGILGGLIYGGYAVLQHVILRYVLYRRRSIPRHYAHFLDYAVSLILLRRVGGGYIFIHRMLLEYFAAQSESPG